MSGLLGKKLGMVNYFTEKGQSVAGTVIEAGPCVVTDVKTIEKHGYTAVQLGFIEVDEKKKKLKKPLMGMFEKIGVKPRRYLREFREFKESLKVGDVVNVGMFRVGEKLKVTGISKGRGFAGVVKRHGFGRPNQSHGTHEIFRGTGAVSAHTYPARVFPGKRFPGRMGNERVSVINLDVLAVDVKKNLIVVKGAVPGATGSIVELRRMEKQQ
ncbi:MAG: 50S ribosomal protein L3 [bacterium]|nr:50S ribosomal protein L3 [bacterium]